MTSRRERAVLTGLASAVAYGLLLRPRLLRWGARNEEVAAPYPGADLIPGGKRGSTMAVTIDGRPSHVWLWLVQMGRDRAGWYSWDRLDHSGVPSEERIHPEWQQIAIGDRLASTPSGNSWFEVAALEPERFLALRAPLDLARRARPFDTAGAWPRFYSDSTWCFLLKELPGGRTRLVVSGYACSRPRALTAVTDFFFWEPAHWIMQTRQFANLKRRAQLSTSDDDHRNPGARSAVAMV
jgi:hypothetical protein